LSGTTLRFLGLIVWSPLLAIGTDATTRFPGVIRTILRAVHQTVDIRPASAADAAALAVVAERTFRDAFGPFNRAEDMDAHCAASYGEHVQARAIADPAIEVVVAERDGELLGYAQLRWRAAPACVVAARPAEVQRLYVDRRWHGTGVAQALMEELLRRAGAGRADAVWLGVWERNPRAIAFYAKYGFSTVGDQPFRLGRDVQRDLVLARPLVP
jgi:ribosomal protein S18 acetylase RimI-like enzyme